MTKIENHKKTKIMNQKKLHIKRKRRGRVRVVVGNMRWVLEKISLVRRKEYETLKMTARDNLSSLLQKKVIRASDKQI